MTPSPFREFSMGTLALMALTASTLLTACGPGQEASGERIASETPEAQEVRLGPVDGRNLPPTELDRVAVGTIAPDFTLRSLGGEPYTLSHYQGDRNVILVFYRGHW